MKWNEINSFSRGSGFVTTPGSHHYQTVKPRLTVLLTRLIHQVCRYVAAGACFKRLCPHKHIIRLSCLLALREKYFTIMDFLVLFLRHDPHWTGESTLSFFIANYKCPKAHWAEVMRIITHTCREKACQCVMAADKRVRWRVTAISNSLMDPRVQTPMTLQQFDQNLAFEHLFLPKDDTSVFWWSGGLFKVSPVESREERTR